MTPTRPFARLCARVQAVLCLLLLATLPRLAAAVELCGLTTTPAAGQAFVLGFSGNGQWAVVWKADTVPLGSDVCILVGRSLSLEALLSRALAIRSATDPKAAFDAAWAQYVTTPLTDPSMAAVVADFRRDACPRLPFVPKECQ